MSTTNFIHSVGDSHSMFWSGWNGVKEHYSPKVKNLLFVNHHLGPVLAYSLNKYGTTAKGREKFDLLYREGMFTLPGLQKPFVMTSFGEIDIRAHLLKKGIDESKTRMAASIANYMEFIDAYKDRIEFIIYGPIGQQSDDSYLNPLFPRYGSENERNKLTIEYNDILKRECNKRNIMFFTLSHLTINSKNITEKKYIIDGCHLSTLFYEEFLILFIKEFNNFYKYVQIDKNSLSPSIKFGVKNTFLSRLGNFFHINKA